MEIKNIVIEVKNVFDGLEEGTGKPGLLQSMGLLRVGHD